jgi:hypothetical protein
VSVTEGKAPVALWVLVGLVGITALLLLANGIATLREALAYRSAGAPAGYSIETDLRLPVTALILVVPASVVAMVGLLRMTSYGYVTSHFVAGLYILLAVHDIIGVVQAPPFILLAVVPALLPLITGVALVVVSWRYRSRFGWLRKKQD